MSSERYPAGQPDHFPVTALGPGPRLGLWVQGCHLACPGCMSRDTWDPYGGDAAAIDDLVAIWRDVRSRARPVSPSATANRPNRPVGRRAGTEDQRLRRRTGVGPGIAGPAERDGGTRACRCSDLQRPGRGSVSDHLPHPCGLRRCRDARPVRHHPSDRSGLAGLSQPAAGHVTALGAERYAGYQEATTAAPAMQFLVEEGRIWTIGVPGSGTCPPWRRSLRAQGIEMGGVSWRP